MLSFIKTVIRSTKIFPKEFLSYSNPHINGSKTMDLKLQFKAMGN